MATLAPNRRITNPSRIYVLGPEARAAYGLALSNREAKKATDDAQAESIRRTTSDDHPAQSRAHCLGGRAPTRTRA